MAAAISDTGIQGYSAEGPGTKRHSTLGRLEASKIQSAAFKWVQPPNDKVSVQVTTFPHGHGVEYICLLGGFQNPGGKILRSDTGIKILPRGLFQWQSTGNVQREPTSEIYSGSDSSYIPGCTSAEWRSQSGEYYEQRYAKLLYHSYLSDPLEPIQFPVGFEELWAMTYSETCQECPERIDAVLSRLGREVQTIVGEWVSQKLENSGLSEEEIQKVIRQYLFETAVCILKFKTTVDVRDFLDPIVQMKDTSAEDRREMNEYLEKRFGESLDMEGIERTPWNLYEKRNMTALGIMSCNPGLCQQD